MYVICQIENNKIVGFCTEDRIQPEVSNAKQYASGKYQADLIDWRSQHLDKYFEACNLHNVLSDIFKFGTIVYDKEGRKGVVTSSLINEWVLHVVWRGGTNTQQVYADRLYLRKPISTGRVVTIGTGTQRWKVLYTDGTRACLSREDNHDMPWCIVDTSRLTVID